MALDSSGRIVDYFSQCAAGGLFERVFPRKNQAGAEKSPDGGTPATARDVFEYYRGFFEKGSSVCYGEGGETFLSFSDPLYKWGDTEWLVYSAECLEGGREDLCLTSFNGRQGGHQRLFRIGYEPSQEGGFSFLSEVMTEEMVCIMEMRSSMKFQEDLWVRKFLRYIKIS